MQKITILKGPVSLPAGCLVRLDENQAKRRAHLLTPKKDGSYFTEGITQWKTGETLETDADLPKKWGDRVKFLKATKEKPGDAAKNS